MKDWFRNVACLCVFDATTTAAEVLSFDPRYEGWSISLYCLAIAFGEWVGRNL